MKEKQETLHGILITLEGCDTHGAHVTDVEPFTETVTVFDDESSSNKVGANGNIQSAYCRGWDRIWAKEPDEDQSNLN